MKEENDKLIINYVIRRKKKNQKIVNKKEIK